MYWVEAQDAVAVKPTPSAANTTKPQFFQSGNPTTGHKATVVPAHFLNTVLAELLYIVQSAGIKPDKMDDTKLYQAIVKIMTKVSEENANDNNGTTEINSNLIYPGAFYQFFEQTPPSGWMVRNGALIPSADKTVPMLWDALCKPENQWRLRTEEQWQNQSSADPWDGVGGVPFFVLNTTMRTIRLPDTRGMYAEDSGFDALVVGGVHGDMIRNIAGELGTIGGDWAIADTSSKGFKVYTGPFYKSRRGGAISNSGDPDWVAGFDASRVVPTGNAIKPRAFGILGCVYVGIAD